METDPKSPYWKTVLHSDRNKPIDIQHNKKAGFPNIAYHNYVLPTYGININEPNNRDWRNMIMIDFKEQKHV